MEKQEVINKVLRFTQPQIKLAKEIGVDKCTLSRVLKGKQEPSKILLTALDNWAKKQVLEVDIKELER